MAKEEKPKKKESKKRRVQKGAQYTVAEGKLVRKNPACPKCGAGIFMAEHKNRSTCGKCGYTKWKQ